VAVNNASKKEIGVPCPHMGKHKILAPRRITPAKPKITAACGDTSTLKKKRLENFVKTFKLSPAPETEAQEHL
jgi:hypothetical protein